VLEILTHSLTRSLARSVTHELSPHSVIHPALTLTHPPLTHSRTHSLTPASMYCNSFTWYSSTLAQRTQAGGCGEDCKRDHQHMGDGDCLLCGQPWLEHYSGHLCPEGGTRGSWLVRSFVTLL
jgi:hypothetical protein